jgi:hypothetical protein
MVLLVCSNAAMFSGALHVQELTMQLAAESARAAAAVAAADTAAAAQATAQRDLLAAQATRRSVQSLQVSSRQGQRRLMKGLAAAWRAAAIVEAHIAAALGSMQQGALSGKA